MAKEQLTIPSSITDIADSLTSALKSWEKTQDSDGSPTSEYGGIEYTSYGPGYNEIAQTLKVGSGAHNIRLLNRVSPDILLVHKSKVVCFHVKVQSGVATVPVPRQIKNMLVKESKFVDFSDL